MLRSARQPDSQKTFEIVRYCLIRIRRTSSKAEGFQGLDEASGSPLWGLTHPKLEARKIEMQSSPSAVREGIDDARRRPFSLSCELLRSAKNACGSNFSTAGYRRCGPERLLAREAKPLPSSVP